MSQRINRSFFHRKLHSLTGLLIVLFLVEHIVTNSQSALLFGESGMGFIRAVNFIKNLPYLSFLEIGLIGAPIVYHGFMGIQYARKAEYNSLKSDGASVSLPEYGRNRSFTWQRITSYILLFGILAHVAYMRFYLYPSSVEEGAKGAYFVRVSQDPGLYTVAERLRVELYDQSEIEGLNRAFEENSQKNEAIAKEAEKTQDEALLVKNQENEFYAKWMGALNKRKINSNEVIAVANDFGTAILLNVRNAFKNPFECVLYTVFVLAAAFHAFNGFWTFLVTWGIILKMRSQKRAVNFCVGVMALIAFLGLASIWGTYWINLKT